MEGTGLNQSGDAPGPPPGCPRKVRGPTRGPPGLEWAWGRPGPGLGPGVVLILKRGKHQHFVIRGRTQACTRRLFATLRIRHPRIRHPKDTSRHVH